MSIPHCKSIYRWLDLAVTSPQGFGAPPEIEPENFLYGKKMCKPPHYGLTVTANI